MSLCDCSPDCMRAAWFTATRTWITSSRSHIDSMQSMAMVCESWARRARSAAAFAIWDCCWHSCRPVADGRIESLIHSYFEERGWTATSHLLVQCRRVLAKQRSDRYRRYLRKCQRDCSEFEVERRAGRYQVSVRADSGRIPAGFFAEPDSLVQSGRMLKDGNSATVVRCEVPDADPNGPPGDQAL